MKKYNDYTLVQLRNLCKKRGLKCLTKYDKKSLVQILSNYDDRNQSDESEEEEIVEEKPRKKKKDTFNVKIDVEKVKRAKPEVEQNKNNLEYKRFSRFDTLAIGYPPDTTFSIFDKSKVLYTGDTVRGGILHTISWANFLTNENIPKNHFENVIMPNNKYLYSNIGKDKILSILKHHSTIYSPTGIVKSGILPRLYS